MYGWKCWRDNRGRFIVNLILLVTVAALIPVIQTRAVRDGGIVISNTHAVGRGWRLPNYAGPQVVRVVWEWTEGLIGLGGVLAIFAGLGLGACGPGEDFTQGTSEFLLTRPRPRKYFVWVGWATAVADLCVILCVTLLVTFAILIYLTRSVYSWRLLTALLPLLTAGAVALSLTYFMTTVTCSARTGLSLGFGFVLIDMVLPPILHRWWNTHILSLTVANGLAN